MLAKLALLTLLGGLAMSHSNEVHSQQSGLDALVRTVRADAARRSGLEEQALSVAVAEEVTWGDGSLGCPSRGQSYTQALVPGYRVRLEGGGKSYDYHANQRGSWIFCPSGRASDAAGPARS